MIKLSCRAALLLGLIVFGLASKALARPVSHKGGWVLSTENNPAMNQLQAHYSPTARYSLGYRGEYWRDKNAQFHGAQWHWLMQRWNMPQSQANLYLKSGAGIALGQAQSKQAATGFTGLGIDWEDRRWFVGYENRATSAGNIDRSFGQKMRFGIAPYLGDYGDMHSWLMVDIEHKPGNRKNWQVSPVLRLFYGDLLGEIGLAGGDGVIFNLTKRF